MKTFNKNLLWLSIATLALSGCGSSNSSDDSSDDHDHEHESSILLSQTGTTALSLLEDGELEVLDDAAAGNGATLVLSENGAYAAALSSGTSTVNFIHGLHEEEEEEDEDHDEEEHEHEEAHVLDFSLDGSQVITTNGHFAVLNSGSTTFVEYDELETITVVPDAINVGVEEYPALMIDEDHDVVMVFVGDEAVIYEDGTATDDSFACATPTSHGQTDELVVVSCDEGALAVVIEEDEATEEHTFTKKDLTLDGTASDYIWRAQGHVIVGFAPETTDYAIVELDESGATPEVVVVEGGDTGSVDLSRNICDIQLESEEQDVLVLVAGDTTNAGDKLVVLDHEGEQRISVTINSSTDTNCDNLVMASASKNALVVDNSARKAYDIDAHEADEGSVNYHVHSTYELTVNDVASVVIFHEKDEEDHDH